MQVLGLGKKKVGSFLQGFADTLVSATANPETASPLLNNETKKDVVEFATTVGAIAQSMATGGDSETECET